MLALMRADSSPPTHRQTQTGWHGASSSYGVPAGFVNVREWKFTGFALAVAMVVGNMSAGKCNHFSLRDNAKLSETIHSCGCPPPSFSAYIRAVLRLLVPVFVFRPSGIVA
ncbi:unnamed protein product [Pleuronectes platessa]|uniref:Uncharacterized protein n=1 Tax=Pleuronectes platessa TaxID=8262 RepID=A0A9N7UXF0_PLEPL|nr:unnamed protein product [Pleuronectes platessa]